jgi:mono/diheme cytochrome c family protein
MSRNRYKFVVLFVLAATLIVGCGSSAPAAPPVPTEVQGDEVAGKSAYMSTCIACHGPEGLGVSGLGKDLTTSEFVNEKSNSELVAFIKTGRPSSDPLNTTGVDMPPKGGNPALNDTDVLNIVAFMRSIHK